MKHQLRNSNGSALLIAVAVLMIFTILGLSLLTLTSNGLAKNENRENIVQATDLADKGVEFAVNEIQKTLETQIKLTPMGKTKFYDYLDEILEQPKLKCNNAEISPTNNLGYKIQGENNTFTSVCIEKVDFIYTNGTVEEMDKYKRLVTFRSTGFVNGTNQTTRTQIIIGTDAIPDQLRYTVSTNNGGNIYLHGGIEIQGDIKTSGNLIIANQASWGTATSSTNTWTPSVYPRIIKNQNSVTPKIVLPEDKNVYVFNLITSGNKKNNSTDFFNKHIGGNELNNATNYTKLELKDNVVNGYFFNTSNLSLVRKKLEDDKVDITAQFNNIPSDSVKYGELTDAPNNSNRNKVFHVKKQPISVCKDYNYYKNECKDWKTTTSSGNIDFTENSTNSKKQIKLTGTYFVDGNVNIQNIQLEADAIIYVKGEVTIDKSILKNTNKDNTLFIFAEKDITFSNMHDSDKTSTDNINEAKGFFYSKSNLMLLGVKSHTKIIGGVSANRVILTGVRGKGKEGSFDSADNQRNKTARLQLIYDENMIKQYHEFKRDDQEEYITQINEPEVISRK